MLQRLIQTQIANIFGCATTHCICHPTANDCLHVHLILCCFCCFFHSTKKIQLAHKTREMMTTRLPPDPLGGWAQMVPNPPPPPQTTSTCTCAITWLTTPKACRPDPLYYLWLYSPNAMTPPKTSSERTRRGTGAKPRSTFLPDTRAILV